MKNRIPRIHRVFKGLDQQGRYREGVHTVEDYKANPFWWVGEVVAAVCFTAAVLFVIALVGLFI